MSFPTDPSPELADYAHPDRLVTTAWLEEHSGEDGLVVLESNEDVLLYDTGHIPVLSRSTGTPSSTTRSSATTSMVTPSPRSCRARALGVRTPS